MKRSGCVEAGVIVIFTQLVFDMKASKAFSGIVHRRSATGQGIVTCFRSRSTGRSKWASICWHATVSK